MPIFLWNRKGIFLICALTLSKRVAGEMLNELGIAQYVLLGKGERMNDGRGRETILADLFEALIGAIYLDGGMDAAKIFFFMHFSERIEEH